MSLIFCPTCGTSTLFESIPELGTLACTSCGTVSSSSSSQAIEFLARVDDEDAYQGGRTYVGAGGVRRNGRAEGWARAAGEATRIYHQKKKGDYDAFIRRLLGRFDLTGISHRVFWMCNEAKRTIKFRWGRSAEIYAAACVYVAAREVNRNVWLFDVASAVDVTDIYTLTRAIRIIKYELQITTHETEPALFLEKILTHLNVIFAEPKPVLHGSSTKGKKTWSASNLDWVRGLSLPSVRDLATGLLSFADATSLVAGRMPEQVASACVLVALEGVARRPAPVGQDFCDELAHLLGGKAFTVQERYREFNKLLADYAPQLPYFAADSPAAAADVKPKGPKKKGKSDGKVKASKRDIVRYTADIVQLRQAIEAKKAKVKKEAEAEEQATAAARTNSVKGKERAVDQNEGEPALAFSDNVVFDEEDEEDEGSDDPANNPLYLDPLASVNASNAYLADVPIAPPHPLPPPKPLKKVTLTDAVGNRAPPLPDGKKRPAEFLRNKGRPGKRLKVIEDIAERLATEASGSGFGAPSPSPVPSSHPSPSLSLSPSAPAPASVPLPDRPAHNDENVRIRQLLLAGHKPSTIYAHIHTPSSMEARAIPDAPKPATRLGRLLWEKPADEVADDELFDAGELDSYVRSQAEVNSFLHLPQTQDMLRVAEEQELARVGRPERRPPANGRRRRRFFARYYPQHDDPADAPREASGSAAGGRRAAREDTTDSIDSFAPRKRKTKLRPEAKARIDALLAMEGIGDEDEDGGSGGGGEGGAKDDSPAVEESEWRMEFALDAARDEGEDLHDNDDDDDDDAPSPAGGHGAEQEEEDWRAALGYGAQQDDDDGGGGYDD
ncbi:hypothetical protein JCM6882_000322 [Rhodosporidiobolus microsporus]